jgi:lysophospholipase L1-like esterase
MADESMVENIQKLESETPKATDNMRWLSTIDPAFTVRGLAWFGENGGSYKRLPLRAQGVVNDTLWELSKVPASAYIAFRSDATSLAIRATNVDEGTMPHMAASGSNGLALYVGTAPQSRLWQIAPPTSATIECTLFEDVPQQLREFRLYLPLYKELTSLDIGLSPGASIVPPVAPVIDRPVVFYGTSITQGGCANTAGTDYVSNLGRLLNINVINLGFSGSGMGEPEVAEFISEIDAALFVLDYATNAKPELLRQTLPGFIRILRARHPETPILIMGPLCYAQYDYCPQVRFDLDEERRISMDVYVNFWKEGDRNIHFVDGYGLIPFGTEAAFVDGVHPTDHGFQLIAQRLSQSIQQILLRDIGL